MNDKTLLLVNSSRVLMDITKKILERVGYSVRCAEGMAEAKELLAEYTPDVIILENDLTDGRGLDYCRELRGDNVAPIMFLSNDKSDELPSFKAGATDFLKKPFDYEILKARIGVMLDNKKIPASADGDTQNGNGNTAYDRIRPEIPSGGTDKKADANNLKTVRSKRMYIAAASCIAFIVLGVYLFITLNDRSTYVDLFTDNVPLAQYGRDVSLPLKDENARPYAGGAVNSDEGLLYFIPHYDRVICSADTAETAMILLNPDENTCGFTFRIILEETEETIYLSGLVEPGMCIENFTLLVQLPQGEYSAALMINAYGAGDRSRMTGANVQFMLIVV